MIVKHTVDGFKWVLDVTDGGIGQILAHSNTIGKDFSYCREKIFMHILDSTIKEGMVCIDLGANIGYATMFMLRNTGTSGFVYAIEPDIHNLNLLTWNIRENDFLDESRVEISRSLISDRNGESSFWIARKPNLNSVRKTKHSIKEEKIPCFSLSSFCKNRRYPNFIKMDIEGHEVSVFNGAYKFFKENRGTTHILLEVHPKFYDEGNDFKKILRKYFDIGFNVKYIVSTPTSNLYPYSDKGYFPIVELESDGWVRSLYDSVTNEDGLEFVCNQYNDIHGKKIARSLMITRE